MRWTNPIMYQTKLDGWWYAWRPVECNNNQTVWLESVYRVWVDQLGWTYSLEGEEDFYGKKHRKNTNA